MTNENILSSKFLQLQKNTRGQTSIIHSALFIKQKNARKDLKNSTPRKLTAEMNSIIT